MQTITAQEAKERFDALVQGVVLERGKYRICSPDGNAILISEKTYEDLMITLEMLSMPLLMESSE